MNEPWYEVVGAHVPITQGDLVFDCPLLGWNVAEVTAGEVTEKALERLIGSFREDLVVLTQACDLEHRKVGNVVLCPHVALSSYREAWEHWMRTRTINLQRRLGNEPALTSPRVMCGIRRFSAATSTPS
jgi:hypothetical protein